MTENHPDGLATLSDRERHTFERIVRAESHATQLRRGIKMDMSTIAWECGFRTDRRVLFTSDAMRALTPTDFTAFEDPLTTVMDERAERVLLAASRRASEGIGEVYAEFSVEFNGENVESKFTVELDRFGGKRAAVVIGWSETDEDTPMRPL